MEFPETAWKFQNCMEFPELLGIFRIAWNFLDSMEFLWGAITMTAQLNY